MKSSTYSAASPFAITMVWLGAFALASVSWVCAVEPLNAISLSAVDGLRERCVQSSSCKRISFTPSYSISTGGVVNVVVDLVDKPGKGAQAEWVVSVKASALKPERLNVAFNGGVAPAKFKKD